MTILPYEWVKDYQSDIEEMVDYQSDIEEMVVDLNL